MIIPVSVAEIFAAPNSAALFAEYEAECSIPEIGKIDPRREVYEAMEKTGLLKCLGVFDGDDLVGFATVIVTPIPHYSQIVATVESVFVQRKSRSSNMGRDLLAAIDGYAKDQGCKAILYSAPTGSRFANFLNYSRKHRKTNLVFCKAL